MQFVTNGPDIPERLLQAHEDGNVVFFCGAGISYPAHLPGFSGLVKTLYDHLSITPNRIQEAAIKAGQFDTAIGLLEGEIIGGRETVRRAISEILTPDLSARNATATHEALLQLARSRIGATRLITTNFDRIFENVIFSSDLTIERFQAPLLPVPKNRWDGLVYLHGLLPAAPTLAELDRLVVSSGDFGLAYLTERWAARFVSELFRNYTVCFVGYSINDPVLRYMMDALAADRLLGESFPEAFAFGNFPKGKKAKVDDEWRAKGVTPILYRNHYRHAYLHRTMWEWAKKYRDGVRGKEKIVVECAMARPLESTRQDDFVGRLLWALSDREGLPARQFSELDPVPSLDWLEPLSEERYQNGDLSRFGVPPNDAEEGRITFSLTRRPTPYTLSPWMSVADHGTHPSRWDEVMRYLAHWLARHLNDPDLILWLVKWGGQLHPDLIMLFDRRLNELADLERKQNEKALSEIRSNAPNAVPGPLMRTLWRLLLTGRVKSRGWGFHFYQWCDQFQRDGLTASLRLDLKQMLTPRVVLREPFRLPEEDGNVPEATRIRDLVSYKIVLSIDHTHTCIRDLSKKERWTSALPDLLADFSALLRDVMDLKKELGSADKNSDLSYMNQPSISPHPQNRHFEEWTALIELTRDAWFATSGAYPERAKLWAELWRQAPYPIFRRLAFFAAAQDGVVSNRQALDWLVEDGQRWLWSNETERETIRLLVALAPQLDEPMIRELEKHILEGPPAETAQEDPDPDRSLQFSERAIWFRLAKIADASAPLSQAGRQRLKELSAKYPSWELADDQRDEFSMWMGDADDWRTFVRTPRLRQDLVKWLVENPRRDFWQDDDWRDRCRENFSTTASALIELADQNIWPHDRWQDALQAWSHEALARRSWRYMARTLAEIPDETLRELDHSLSWWLRSIAKHFNVHEPLFIAIAWRLLDVDRQNEADTDDPVARAINHPIGHTTQALLQWWFRNPLEDDQGLPEVLVSIFSHICNVRNPELRHGRLLLATHVVVLFRVDREWTIENLLPLFSWDQSEIEARGAWQGFLGSPRLYRPLIERLKIEFLDTSGHYETLGEYGRNYASLLAFAALDNDDLFTVAELATATRRLPSAGLRETARALNRVLESAREQRLEQWNNRIVPYLRNVWPKSRKVNSRAISGSLARLCIAARESFPEAVQLLRAWLQPPEHADYVIHKLHESRLCGQFPEQTLDFLDLVVDRQGQWAPSDLAACLDAIRASAPELEEDYRFEQLVVYLRRHGRGLG